MNTFYRVLLRGIRTARRATGHNRMSLRLRRAALRIERLLPSSDLADEVGRTGRELAA